MENPPATLTNPWLRGALPTAKLARIELEERILNLLSSQNMCVVATTGEDGPVATPVRYYHFGMALVFTSQAEAPKIRNIRRDPRVSVGVFAPHVGQASSRGAQLFGRARLVYAGDTDFDSIIGVYRWQSDAVERGRSLDERPEGPAVVIDPERVVYTEHWLRRSGYAPRQHWRRTHASRSPD